MSASEKLKALAGAEQSAEAASLMRALPQIVAVVEAAEKHVDTEWAAFAEFGEPEHGDMPPNTSVTNAKLSAALNALEEALGGD